MEKDFREKFEALNRIKLTNTEFKRLLDDIVTPDDFTTALTHSPLFSSSMPTAFHPAVAWLHRAVREDM